MGSPDFEEFIAALNAHGVRYLIVGAHAVAFHARVIERRRDGAMLPAVACHARPRATKDLDVLIEPTDANARRTLKALREFFGGADLGYTVDDLTDPSWIIQLGVAPIRIDLLAAIPGCPSFNDAWNARVQGRFGSVSANYLSLDDLIRAKEAPTGIRIGPMCARCCARGTGSEGACSHVIVENTVEAVRMDSCGVPAGDLPQQSVGMPTATIESLHGLLSSF